jgi:hypothetical protein
MTPEYPAKKIKAAIDAALRDTGRRGLRRTRREAAAERLVDAIAVLVGEGVEDGDVAVFEEARAAVERYRRADA